ncbi:MAG: cytochrome P450 [Frankia sp.]|nr:cytochrome P450 [Frankia sp.]
MSELTAPTRLSAADFASRFPAHVGAARLFGEAFHADPHGLYRALRARHGGVAPVLLEGGLPAWIILGYREYHYVCSHPELFVRDSRLWNAWDLVSPDWPVLPMLIERDTVWWFEGAEHERRSEVLHDALGVVDRFELRGRCERIADRLIDDFVATGEADLISQFAEPMPILALAALLEIPSADVPDVARDMNATLDQGEDAQDAYLRMRATLGRLAARRRESPGFGVLSRLALSAAGLSDEALLDEFLTMFNFGHQAVGNWIGNTLRLMLCDPRFTTTLAGGRSSVAQAMEAVLWEDPPDQNISGRWVVRTSHISGQRVEAGDMLVLSVAAANADPQIRPAAAVGASGNQAHMAFGHGNHRCPYPAQEIGEVIARTAVEVLLDRLPDVTLAVAPEELVWRPAVWVRGLAALPVVFTPA